MVALIYFYISMYYNESVCWWMEEYCSTLGQAKVWVSGLKLQSVSAVVHSAGGYFVLFPNVQYEKFTWLKSV